MNALTLDDLRKANFTQIIQCFDSKQNELGVLCSLQCRIEKCSKKYKDKSGAIRHIRQNHRPYYNVIVAAKKSELTNASSLIEIRILVDPDKIRNACVRLICSRGLPLSFVEFPEFKEILEPYVIGLERNGYNLVINRQNTRNRIVILASTIMVQIKEELKGKLVAVMADIGSKYNRSVLGISIAYMVNGKKTVRTIGMHVLKYSHTADYIAETIKTHLSYYNIQLNQVISITTDNGKNMVKSVALLDHIYQANKVSTDEVTEVDIDEIIDHDIFDEEYYDDLLANVRLSFPDIIHSDMIHGVACAAHCIHLVIMHAIEKSERIANMIDKGRQLAKVLRTPKVRAMIKAAGYNAALLDVVTRWNSICCMVIEDLIKFLCL